jgi:hypothetical protein
VPKHAPSDAEKVMQANAKSRAHQGSEADRASKTAAEPARAATPPSRTNFTGPSGGPAEGKR